MTRILAAALAYLWFVVQALASCTIPGDSIALGLCVRVGVEIRGARCHAPLEMCTGTARQGAASGEIIGKVVPARVVIVSVGSNDWDQKRLVNNMATIRARAQADKVIWIVPASGWRARTVEARARFFGDPVVRFAPRSDGVHPASYKALAVSVRATMGP